MSNEDRFAELPKGVRICYRSYGPPAGEAILLIAGLGLQLTSWPQDDRRGSYSVRFGVWHLFFRRRVADEHSLSESDSEIVRRS